jgi:hypothetical protein
MKLAFFSVLLIGACSIGNLRAADSAQDSSPDLFSPKKLEYTAWRSLGYVKFKDSKYDRGMDILKHFLKASRKAELPDPTILMMRSGKWSVLLIFPMADGVRSMEWEIAPEDAKFFKALADLEGGADKARALWGEYLDCIQDSYAEVAVSSEKK